MSWSVLDGRLNRLEKQQRQQAGAAQNWDAYQFRVSTTCPPSTSIIIRGGRAWTLPTDGIFFGGQSWYVPTETVDLAANNLVYPDYTFSNANWYVPAWCSVNWDWSDTDPADVRILYLTLYGQGEAVAWFGGGLEEVETAAEAEAKLDGFLGDELGLDGCPLCGLVLRNNGDTDSPNQYMEIDPINRGRSYIYSREIRKINRV